MDRKSEQPQRAWSTEPPLSCMLSRSPEFLWGQISVRLWFKIKILTGFYFLGKLLELACLITSKIYIIVPNFQGFCKY